jgi:alpha-galactosidase
VLRGGGPGASVSVTLSGASELTIEARDAGDGIACDHADWADARVLLMDGTELWLSDLPMLTPEPRPRSIAEPPFSFVYGGKTSDELLSTWQFKESTKRLDASRTERTQVYSDPQTGLVVRCVLLEYEDFPTVEWTLHFKNTGGRNTPVLSDIFPLDTRFRGREGAECLLHHSVGSPCQPNDYQPLETTLGPGDRMQVTAACGRPTSSDLPCFNIEWPPDAPDESRSEGVIVVVGWPGQWAVDFMRDSSDGLRVCGRQELTRFRLLPGEEVRSPLVVLQFWRGGDWIRAQNTWRRWMIAHNLPRPGGKLVAPHYGSCFGNLQPSAEEEIAVIKGFLREGIRLDYWYLDAGWYPNGGSWVNTGTWKVDTQRFPHGLRQVADILHDNGIKFVVWFEPERVTAGSWLARNHPEWVIGGKSGGLLNLGNPEAWAWLVNHFDHLITSEGIDVYRQDFNIDPLHYWRSSDAEDRLGITEIKHVTGYLAYWDELLRRHPGMLIDTCASGGRRNDLETLRRAVPLLRSDYWNDPIAQQSQTYGISLWIPYHGSGMAAADSYWFRSCIFPASRVGCDTRKKDLDYPLIRRMIGEFRRVEPYLLGDYYPLTPYSLENDVWIAWQFDRPETGEGMVQVFRRAESTLEAARIRLRGLMPEASYSIASLDSLRTSKLSGKELMEEGLDVTIAKRPGAVFLTYEKVTP